MPIVATIVSVNVGTPKRVQAADGSKVYTGIFKSPVQGKVAVRKHNLEGDRQADLRVHGGPYKAVYVYPEEHYGYWRQRLPGTELPFGIFGENLTTLGLTEGETYIGDRFRIGSALLQATQPRMPCYKLGIRFGRPEMVKDFWESDRLGIYFSVLEEGHVSAGDPIERETHAADGISVADVVALYRGTQNSIDLFERALRAPLSGSWMKALRQRYTSRERSP